MSFSRESQLQIQCICVLMVWQFGSKMAGKSGCVVIVGSLLIIELLLGSIGALLRLVSFFTKATETSIIPYELYGLLVHLFLVVLVKLLSSSRPDNWRTTMFITLFHVPSLVILTLFSGLIYFLPGDHWLLSLIVSLSCGAFWALISLIFTRNGICIGVNISK